MPMMSFAPLSHLSRFRLAYISAIAGLAIAGAFAPVEAAMKKTDKKDDAVKPALIASFGDWNVFVGQVGKGRICYTLAQPKAREPSTLKRDPGYAFISDRPAEGVRNEVSFIMGFEVSVGTEAQADTKSDVRPDAKPEKPSKLSKTASKAKAKSIDGPVAAVDEAAFDLLPKGGNLWVKNAARESELITEMKKGSTLEIRAASLKGNASTDSYSLSGFSQAMERLQKECPPKP
jgi:invasion protein IalB